MGKKLIISEGQLDLLSKHIFESKMHHVAVKEIVDDLNLNYKPSKGTYKKGGEYYEKPMVLNKVSQELITLKSLFDYISYKYDYNPEFNKQVIIDWYSGNISDSYVLSKNITVD